MQQFPVGTQQSKLSSFAVLDRQEHALSGIQQEGERGKPMAHMHMISFCPRVGSVTRQLGDHFLQHWQGSHSQRDLVTAPVPMIDAELVNAYIQRNYRQQPLSAVPPALQSWDAALQETRDADILVLVAPVYNFSVPTPVHAWFDAVLQRGLAWDRIGDRFVGCLGPTTFVWLTSCGSIVDSDEEGDLARAWFRQNAEFLGATASHCVVADGQSRTAQQGPALRRALQQVKKLALDLSSTSVFQHS